jgi:hypothetical protein
MAAKRAQEEQHAQAVAACARPEVRASRALGRRKACGSRRRSRVGAAWPVPEREQRELAAWSKSVDVLVARQV